MSKTIKKYPIFYQGEEYEEIDNKFASKDNPWITCRFTAMLPIKMEFMRNNNV